MKSMEKLLEDKRSYDWYINKYRFRGWLWRKYIKFAIAYKLTKAMIITDCHSYEDPEMHYIYGLMVAAGKKEAVRTILINESDIRKIIFDKELA